MWLDILNEDNSLTLNLKSIQIFGLTNAAYITALIAIFKKATRKNKLYDKNYFKIDRNYIKTTLNLPLETQLVCDSNLIRLNLLKKKDDNPDIISFDIKLYLSLISEEDFNLIENVKKQMEVNKPKGIKQTQKQRDINALKDSIRCSNYELLTALRDWVDGVYANPKGFLSRRAITLFQDTLNNYTQGDLDLALKLVDIATVNGYRDCQWAIDKYEKSIKSNSNSIRITQQKISTKDSLSDVTF